MEVRYRLKRNEVWNGYWVTWRGGLKWIHLYLFIMVLVGFLYSDYKGDVVSSYTIIKSGLSFLGLFSFMVLFPQLMYKPQVRVLSIDDNGIHTKIAKYSKVIPWGDVSSIDRSDGYINIIGKNRNVMLVPERAFPGSKEMQAFYRYASSRISDVRNF